MDLQVWLELFFVLGCGVGGIASLAAGKRAENTDREDWWERIVEED
jgi:hypothetical protein